MAEPGQSRENPAQLVWYHDLKWDARKLDTASALDPIEVSLHLSSGSRVSISIQSPAQLTSFIDQLERAI